MVFSSPSFLFLFLPLALLLFFAVPARARTALLVLVSFVFYAWGELFYVYFLAGSVAANYALGLLLGRARGPSARKWLIAAGVVLNIGALAYFKYTGFLWQNLATLLPLPAIGAVHLPIGVSFITFEALSYLVDVYRGHTDAQRNPLHVALYVSFFPHLIAGPVLRFADVQAPLARPRVTLAGFDAGVRRFVVGLAKKVLVANTVGQTADQIFALPASDLSTGAAWLGLTCYALQIYYDFSGYSDMAIGLGRLFGFELPRNFDLPYAATSIKDFWRRWHISLSTWFRDYLYIPLGGNRVAPWRQYLNLVLVFLLCGLWHGASWTFVGWGAFHGVFLVLERLPGLRGIDRAWRPIRHAYVTLVVLVGWSLFRSDTVGQAWSFVCAMAGAASAPRALRGDWLNTLDRELLVTMLVAIPLATLPLERWSAALRARLDGRRWALQSRDLADTCLHILLFVMSVAYLASGTFNPFIYYRF